MFTIVSCSILILSVEACSKSEEKKMRKCERILNEVCSEKWEDYKTRYGRKINRSVNEINRNPEVRTKFAQFHETLFSEAYSAMDEEIQRSHLRRHQRLVQTLLRNGPLLQLPRKFAAFNAVELLELERGHQIGAQKNGGFLD